MRSEFVDYHGESKGHNIGAHPRNLIARRVRNNLHGRAENATGIIRPCNRQLILQTAYSTDITDEGGVSAEEPHENVCNLPAHPSSVAPREDKDDLNNAPNIADNSISLASAGETVVCTIKTNFLTFMRS